MRGKAKNRCRSCPLTRITPAYAGKRQEHSSYRTNRKDHPRVCGEKKSRRCCTSIGLGSPPRVRGKAAFDTGHRQVEGITPAYAGKSSPGSAAGCHARDHPRVCGEKGRKMKQQFIGLGSPPRMRGKGELRGEPGKDGGITPAYAGKRNPRLGHKSRVWDHPRVCGEKG